MAREEKTQAAELPRDLAHLPEHVRERIRNGDAFGPPMTRRPKVDVRDLVRTLQEG